MEVLTILAPCGIIDVLGDFICVCLYLFAGRQTFWLVMLLDPEGGRCPITAAQAHDALPKTVFFAFVLAWPLLLAWGWACNRVQKPEPL